MILEQRLQRADQPSTAGLAFEFSILGGEGNRDAVGNQNQVGRLHGAASTGVTTADAWFCEPAIQASRNSSSSLGGRSQKRAKDARTSARTRMEKPRLPIAAKASSSVRSSPR